MRTPEQIAAAIRQELVDFPQGWVTFEGLLARAVREARALEMPGPLAGVITPSTGGIFRNASGDYLVEPIGDETGELILFRTNGTTATIRGEWETGWEA